MQLNKQEVKVIMKTLWDRLQEWSEYSENGDDVYDDILDKVYVGKKYEDTIEAMVLGGWAYEDKNRENWKGWGISKRYRLFVRCIDSLLEIMDDGQDWDDVNATIEYNYHDYDEDEEDE